MTTDLRADLTEERLRRILAGAARRPAVLAEPLTGQPMTVASFGNAAAGVLYVDGHGRVLLVQPRHKPYWDLPGGIVELELGESPRDAARREVKEELGCSALPVGDLLVVDYLPSIDGRPAGIRYVFGCLWSQVGNGYPFRLQDEEIISWAWCTPEEQQERQEHAPILARRVAAARAALHGRRTVYLENGHEVNR